MVHIGNEKAHFSQIIEKNNHYIDKTDYIERLENSGESFVFFLRPSGFGKSLWISILYHYYDIRFKSEFDILFGKYYIGKNPTPNANKYHVLNFDFSDIDTENKETIYNGFLTKIHRSVDAFLLAHNTVFTKEESEIVLANNRPNSLIDGLFSLIREKKLDSEIYILIDEYDYFANQLMLNQVKDFKEIVSKCDFVRVFYETLKTAAGQGLIERIFITGILPIPLDSLTSGFNIATNLSLDEDFHNMMGFTNDEVRQLLQLMDVEGADLDIYNNLLKIWYNGYKFNPRAADFLYNPSMVLYFAADFNRLSKPLDEMLYPDTTSSHDSIRSLFRLPKRGANEFESLQDLLEKREVSVNVVQIFNFELEFTTTDFLSLLFYMGFLTIKGQYAGSWILQMPNRVIEQLYYKYFVQLLSEKTNYAEGVDTLENALKGLIQQNNPVLLADLITYTLTNLAGRDATVPFEIREKNVQVLLFAFLSFSHLYLVESEYNAQGQYFDILATDISQNRDLPFNFLFELKYLPKAGATRIKSEFAKAKIQIAQYQQTSKAQSVPNLKAWIMIVVGTEVKICKQV